MAATPTIKTDKANILEGQVVRFILIDDTVKSNVKEVQIAIDDDTPIRTTGVNSSRTFVLKRSANKTEFVGELDTSGYATGNYSATYGNENTNCTTRFCVSIPSQTAASVTLNRASGNQTPDQALWVAIRNRTNAIGFARYQRFIDLVFGCKQKQIQVIQNPLSRNLGNIKGSIDEAAKILGIQPEDVKLNVHGPYSYALLKLATQVFLTLESGVVISDGEWNGHKLFDTTEEAYRLSDPTVTPGRLKLRLEQYLRNSTGGELPYLDRIVNALLASNSTEVLPYCYGVLQYRSTHPSLIELIWSYWEEQGMLAQTMNAIALRFQNQRSSTNDPLAEMEIDPLRPLNNLIWGFVQDRHNLLSVGRRASEYDHQYGLKLMGRAVPELRSADSRSKFIEAFHNLLYRTAVFYREDADTTVVADAFPLLNALKDVHLLLAEGAHNQYGDLPWTARAEMLTQQWMLARPEMREFLRGRHMVPYQEEWMGAVDAMKKLQGWTDTTITHFNELAVDGERLLLSIRFGDWSDLNNTEEQSRNWARYWKPEIQRYLYGYLAVTGVDLMADITDNREAATRNLQPSMLLQRRITSQTRQSAFPSQRVKVAS